MAEHTAGPTTVLWHQPDGSQVAVECPPLLSDYQQYMHGVDCGDQYIGLYNVGRRSKKYVVETVVQSHNSVPSSMHTS